MARRRQVRNRFWVEAVLAGTTGVLTVVTLVFPEWIEIVFNVDPDGGSGVLEWAIVAALATAALLFGLLARAEWRHLAANPAR